jgi:hypothetical protein
MMLRSINIISLNMAGTPFGTLQYNYGYSGFDNSFNTRIRSSINYACTCKKRIPSNMIGRSSICKGQTER